MPSPDVTANRNMAKNQCKSIAGAELCSSALGELVEPDHRRRIHAYGVVILLAKKREKGRIPSLAISCFTIDARKQIRISGCAKGNEPFGHFSPFPAVNVVMKRLPKIERAMIPAITRSASSFWKAVLKNKVAMSRPPSRISRSFGTTHSCEGGGELNQPLPYVEPKDK